MKKKMKSISLLSLLLIGFKYVQAGVYVDGYSTCKTCKIVTIEDGINWGIEKNNWCSK